MLILEIILTIVAYKKGWKLKALIPCGISFSIGFFIGLVRQSTSLYAYSDIIWIDLLAIIALIYMCVKPYEEKNEDTIYRP